MNRFAASWLSAAIALGSWSSAFAAETLTASSWLPPTHLLHVNVLQKWAADVDQATQGRVKVNILPKPVAAPPGHFDAVRDGLADVAYIVHGYTPGRFALTKLVELPFMGDSAEAISVAYQRAFEKHLAKANEHKGVTVLCVFTHGPGQIFNTKKAIVRVDDLAGMKFRVGGGVVNDVAKAIGASALLKPATESYELLSTGVADGALFPAESIQSFKLDKIVKYGTIVPGGLYNVSFAFLMNEARFAKLAKADQDAILAVSGQALARSAGKAWDEHDAQALALLKTANVSLTPASAGFVAEVKSKTAAIEESVVKEVAGKGVDGAAVLAELRAEIKQAATKR